MASSGGSSLMQGFTLPGEADKAAKIMRHFLGESGLPLPAVSERYKPRYVWQEETLADTPQLADPTHPQTALNSVPKAVLQRAKGMSPFSRTFVLPAGWKTDGGILTRDRSCCVHHPQGGIRLLR